MDPTSFSLSLSRFCFAKGLEELRQSCDIIIIFYL
ncbi:hypothetical protein OIU78_000517, partial [Salix suchowensis]